MDGVPGIAVAETSLWIRRSHSRCIALPRILRTRGPCDHPNLATLTMVGVLVPRHLF